MGHAIVANTEPPPGGPIPSVGGAVPSCPHPMPGTWLSLDNTGTGWGLGGLEPGQGALLPRVSVFHLAGSVAQCSRQLCLFVTPPCRPLPD